MSIPRLFTAGLIDDIATVQHRLGLKESQNRFSSGKDVSTFTAMPFDLDRRTAESVANFEEMDIMIIACKESGRGRVVEGGNADRRVDRSLCVFGRVPGDICNIYE